MRELVENYRGVDIYKSDLIVAGPGKPLDWHEAAHDG